MLRVCLVQVQAHTLAPPRAGANGLEHAPTLVHAQGQARAHAPDHVQAQRVFGQASALEHHAPVSASLSTAQSAGQVSAVQCQFIKSCASVVDCYRAINII